MSSVSLHILQLIDIYNKIKTIRMKKPHIQTFDSYIKESNLNEAMSTDNLEAVAIFTAIGSNIVGYTDIPASNVKQLAFEIADEIANFFDGVGSTTPIITVINDTIHDLIGEFADYDDFKETYKISKEIAPSSVKIREVQQMLNKESWIKIQDVIEIDDIELGIMIYNNIARLH